MVSWWLLLLVAAASWSELDACSCMPMHPQTHYCKADFVIVGRVQQVFPAKQDDWNGSDVYKVKIRHIFKATPKAQVALQSGRIFTSSGQNSPCASILNLRETYILTGHVYKLDAHVNLCSYTQLWRNVTPRQRKGFRMLYENGCSCKVQTSIIRDRQPPKSPNTCHSGFNDCYDRHGVCINNKKGRCVWARAPRLMRCLQMQSFNGTMI